MPNINQVTDNDEEKKGFGQNPVNRFTFKQWLSHPTTILLILVTTFLWALGVIYVNSQLQQVEYLKERIQVLEDREEETKKEMQAYIRALMFKETQLKEQKIAIDSLKSDIK